MTLLRLLPWLLLAASTQAAAQYAPRLFDVVAPEGHSVQDVEGTAVLRLPGEPYGAVVTFLPESAVSGWVTLAVLNTGDQPLKIRTSDISAHYGRTALKIYSTEGLIRDAKQRRRDMLAYSQNADGKSMKDLARPNRALDESMSPSRTIDVESGRRRLTREPRYIPRNEEGREALEFADAQLLALTDRLFMDTTLEPGKFNRGDIRLDLPPRRRNGATEFVLTLDFGGKVTEVMFRERSTEKVEVGEPEIPADAG